MRAVLTLLHAAFSLRAVCAPSWKQHDLIVTLLLREEWKPKADLSLKNHNGKTAEEVSSNWTLKQTRIAAVATLLLCALAHMPLLLMLLYCCLFIQLARTDAVRDAFAKPSTNQISFIKDDDSDDE